MGFELTTKRIAVIMAVIAVVSVSAAFFYSYEVRYVPTDSMDGDDQPYDIPTIPQGSAILVSKFHSQSDIDGLEDGDVILFSGPIRDTVHRIVPGSIIRDVDGHITHVTTKGDNTSSTESVDSKDIQGKVVAVSEELGGVVHFVQNSTLFLVLIVVILLVMASVVWDMIKIRRSEGQ